MLRPSSRLFINAPRSRPPPARPRSEARPPRPKPEPPARGRPTPETPVSSDARSEPDSTLKSARRRTLARLLLHDSLRLLTYAIALGLGWHIFEQYFFSCRISYGISMVPTLASIGDYLVISKYYRRGRGIEVGDLVSFKHPLDAEVRSVKRVIGLAGDFVLGGTPGVGSGMMLQVPRGHCWVVGDNVTHSRDSRIFGPLPLALVRGKIIARVSPWPFEASWIKNPVLTAPTESDVD